MLSKADKLNAYVYAYIMALSQGKHAYGTCHRLSTAFEKFMGKLPVRKRRFYGMNSNMVRAEFPEMWGQKPVNRPGEGSWWCDGSTKRLRAIERAISLTEKLPDNVRTKR